MKTLPSDDPQDKKAATLRATLELISEQGLDATPMSQIASRANIGVGTIYRYFDNKEQLINALYLQLKTRVNQAVIVDHSDELPVKELFIKSLKNVFHYYLENPSELRFLEQYENSPILTASTREENMRLSGPAYRLLQRGLEQQLIKELPVGILGALFSGALTALAKFHLSAGGTFQEQELDTALEGIWDMLSH